MANKLGLLPAAKTEVYSAGEVDTLLDGKIPYFEGTREDGETDIQVLERITNGKTVKVGGIAVIKTVVDDSTTYTAYKYISDDGSDPDWKVMDGSSLEDVGALKSKLATIAALVMPSKETYTTNDLYDILKSIVDACKTPEPAPDPEPETPAFHPADPTDPALAGTVSTEGEVNEDGTLTVEGEVNEDGTLTVETETP